MKRICCSEFHVGDKFFGHKEPFENQEETHGFCADCLPLELKKMERELNEIQTRNQTNPSTL